MSERKKPDAPEALDDAALDRAVGAGETVRTNSGILIGLDDGDDAAGGGKTVQTRSNVAAASGGARPVRTRGGILIDFDDDA